MIRDIRSVGLFVLMMVLLISGSAFAMNVDAELAVKLDAISPDEFVRVMIRMEERPFVSSIMDADTAVAILKDTSARTQASVLDFLAAQEAENNVRAYTGFWIANVVFAEIRADAVRELAALAGVLYVYEDIEITIDVTTDEFVPAAEPIWDTYAATFAPEVWEMGYKGRGVTVAIMDTGVDIGHPELADAMGGEPPFHEEYWAEIDVHGGLVPVSFPRDTHGHGTHVAGSAVGRSVGEHTVGIAPEATLAGVLVMHGGTGTLPQALGGMQWVAEQGFDVLNGSLGANGVVEEDFAVAVDNLIAAGVVPVFSNGNILPDNPILPPGAPGNTPGAIAVGAFGPDGEEADFNQGAIVEYPGYAYDEFTRIKPDISGPGVGVYSALRNGGYVLLSGTSMASPQVAGTAALMLSANPNLRVRDVKDALFGTTGGHEEAYGWNDIPTKDIHFGWGRLNALHAVQAVMPSTIDVVVAGTVMSSNELLADATITFDGPVQKQYETNADGYYEAELIEGRYTITAAAKGFTSESVEMVLVRTDEILEVNFLLEPVPFGNVVGQVLDEQNNVLVDAKVTDAETGLQVKTDASGRYAIDLPSGERTLQFSGSGFFPQQRVVVVLPHQATQADVRMEFGYRTLTGTTTDLAGNPIAGVAVTAGDVETLTDSSGVYALDLEPGAYTVNFDHPRYMARTTPTAIKYGATTRKDVSLEAKLGGLQGTVQNLDGVSVEGAVVSIDALDVRATTDAEGEYEISDVPVGVWRITVEHDSYWPQAATANINFEEVTIYDFSLQSSDVNALFQNSFDTEEERSVWERDNQFGGDHQWWFTTERSVSEPYSAWHGDAKTGSYPIDPVSLRSPSFQVPDRDDVTLTFMLSGQIYGPYHQFQVSVFDVNGPGTTQIIYTYNEESELPWTEVTVSLAPFAGKEIQLFFSFTPGFNFVVRPEDSGMFIDDVLVGYVDPAFDSVITGIVRDEGGEPVEGVAVTVQELLPTSSVGIMSQSVTDADGRYVLTVPAGGWTVSARKTPDYVDVRDVVYVEPGGTTTADLILPRNIPLPPVDDLAADVMADTVRLHWSAGDEAAVAYTIYRSLDNEHFHLIGETTESEFTAIELQDELTYYFRVHAVDAFGLEGQGALLKVTPMVSGPTVRSLDVEPRSMSRGRPFHVRASLGHTDDDDTPLHVEIAALQGVEIVRTWSFSEQSQGSFEAVVESADLFGTPWRAGIYGIVLSVTDDAERKNTSDTINIIVLAPLPEAFSFLLDNNPFDPKMESQRVDYVLPTEGRVNVSVYTLDGRRVRTLVDEMRSAGQHMTFWDGNDDDGRVVLAGMYVVRVQFIDADGQATNLTRHSVVVK